MALKHHPTGVEVEVVGIESGDRGRSCEEHEVCGSVIEPDTVVRFRSVTIINGKFLKWELPGLQDLAVARFLTNFLHYYTMFLKTEARRSEP